MEHRLLSYRDSTISYYRYGTGPRIMLCFHGYGEDGRVYKFFGEEAGDRFSFYSFDLPFHGRTAWRESDAFLPADLTAIIHLVLPEDAGKFSIMGFSLGGRIALALFEKLPHRVEQVLLLAPDGLKINFWYWLSTQTWLGNKIFAAAMRAPGGFFSLLKLGRKLGFVNASIFKFVNFYIKDPQARHDLYHRWTGLRKFRPHAERVKNSIRSYMVPVTLFYGRHDRIIIPSRGEKFQKDIPGLCRIQIIESGHQVLHRNHSEALTKALPR